MGTSANIRRTSEAVSVSITSGRLERGVGTVLATSVPSGTSIPLMMCGETSRPPLAYARKPRASWSGVIITSYPWATDSVENLVHCAAD